MRKLIRPALFALALLPLAGTALAQTQTTFRTVPIPADPKVAPKAVIGQGVFPTVLLNGKPFKMAAGAKIFGANNLIVLHANLPVGAVVRYALNPNGEVRTIWILTDAEKARNP
ncbi:MAG TPA: hypothetical protein VFK82_11985 [Burkholderiaceae bacterium]|nr:hypothetical protein [Burkholderiaceae bacterium]